MCKSRSILTLIRAVLDFLVACNIAMQYCYAVISMACFSRPPSLSLNHLLSPWGYRLTFL